MSVIQFVNTNTLIRKYYEHRLQHTSCYLCYLFVAFDVHKEKTSTLAYYKYYLLCLEKETLYKQAVASPPKSAFQNEVLHSERSINFFERLTEQLPVTRFFHYFLQTILKRAQFALLFC